QARLAGERRIAREVRELALEVHHPLEGARGAHQHVDAREVEAAHDEVARDVGLVPVDDGVEARAPARDSEREALDVEAIEVEPEAAAAALQRLAEQRRALAEEEVAAADEVIGGAV